MEAFIEKWEKTASPKPDKTDKCSKQDNPDKSDNSDKPKRKKVVKTALKSCFTEGDTIEVGIDEAGRGPMFGRVYAAAAILPKDDSFNHTLMKDSKRFHSKKRIMEAYEYIKENAIAYCVQYSDEDTIDRINIRQATLQTMHNAVKGLGVRPDMLLVDGNDFKPMMRMNASGDSLEQISHVCIEGGDNKYTPIAAASILAKVERDLYIEKLCEENPELEEHYGILSNKGYGTKKHLDGIRERGITPFHRKTYGICKDYC